MMRLTIKVRHFCVVTTGREPDHGLDITAQNRRAETAHHGPPCKIARGAGTGNAQRSELNPNRITGKAECA